MKTYISQTTRLLVICIIIFLVNLTITSNYNYVNAANLTNDGLRPEMYQFWKYRNKDLVDGWVFEFTLKVVDEKVIRVGNKDVPVFVLEGDGKVIEWAYFVPEYQRSNDNKISIKKELRKDNLEMVTYTLNISYSFTKDGNFTENFYNEFTTYDYLEISKPDNITVGSNWTKLVKRTQVIERRAYPDEKMIIIPPSENINSTVDCDRLSQVEVPAGSFDTYRFVEQQYVQNIRATTLFYYYSIAAKGYVKMVRWDATSTEVEIEELLEYGIDKPDDPNNHVGPKNNDSDEPGWFDLNNKNVQFILLFMAIIAVIAIMMKLSKKKKN